MKKLLLFSLLAFCSQLKAQNVGIDVPNPSEKLDIRGNINLTGTIKANGVDGTPNQVLMKNSGGLLAWGDLCEYKNIKVFEYTDFNAIQTFMVPAGITKIKLHAWGGGGKGDGVGGSINMGGGGGGGGYIEASAVVTPSTPISIVVGKGATSAAISSVSYLENGTWGYYAYGGENSVYNSVGLYIELGRGGQWGAANSTSHIGIQGETGKPSILRFDQISATEFAKAFIDGNGGNAGNTTNTGGQGGFLFKTTSTNAVLSQSLGRNGLVPGGGAPSQSIINAGGNGRVIIYW